MSAFGRKRTLEILKKKASSESSIEQLQGTRNPFIGNCWCGEIGLVIEGQWQQP
jgi:hypothetical protein